MAINIPITGLKKTSGINIPIDGLLKTTSPQGGLDLGLSEIGGMKTSTPAVMPSSQEPSFFSISKETIKGLPKATVQVAKAIPQIVKSFVPAITKRVEQAAQIWGEGLAYLIDPNVRKQYEAGNLDILPTISKTSLLEDVKNTGGAMIEAAVYLAFPSSITKNIYQRFGIGALRGLGFAIAEGAAKNYSTQQVIDNAKSYGAVVGAIEMAVPYLGRILAANIKDLPAITKKSLQQLKQEFRQPIREVERKIEQDLIKKGYSPEEAKKLATQGGYLKQPEPKKQKIIPVAKVPVPVEKGVIPPQVPAMPSGAKVEYVKGIERPSFVPKGYTSEQITKMAQELEKIGKKTDGLREDEIVRLYQAVKVKPILPPTMPPEIPLTGGIIKEPITTLTKVRGKDFELVGIPKRIGFLPETRLEREAVKMRKEFKETAIKEKAKAIKEEKDFLASIKTGILKIFDREKNQLRKQIGFERHTKGLSGTVLSRIKEKYGIREWKNANKEQLQKVLDDFKNLQKADEMISRSQVESLKEFGIKNWTTKREAADIMGDVLNWKNRTNRFFDFFKTINQKIEQTAGKDTEKVKDILTRPRAKAVTEMFKKEINLKTEMKDMLDKLGVNNEKDRALIMRFGEKRISLEELKKATPKWQQIQEADKWFRNQYNNLLEKANTELKRLGYSEDKLIPKRQDYYTHSQELGTLWNLAKNQGGDINPVLEQISEFTRPNRKFNPFALPRKGGTEFIEDAGKAFEAYLNPILNNIYLTESIVRHRAIADILAHKTLQTKNLNQFIFSLRDAADSLAGKTNPFDRALMNRVFGRKPIRLVSWMSQRFAKNRIIGNVGSALMQISGIPSSVIKNNIIRTLKGLLTQAISPFLGKNDPLLKSEFLLRRYGEKELQHGESVFPSIIKKGEKVASISFEVIETNITKGIWRASFDNAWSQGFRGKELMDKADEITMSIVGARGIGEKALAFESGVLSLPLQFQLEVNASAQLWKDEIFGKIFKNPLQATRAAIETSITLYLMNTLFDKTIGRTPLPDPIRAISDASKMDDWFERVGRLSGEVLANVAGGQFIAGLIPQETRKKYFGRSEVGIYPGGIPVTTALEGGFRNPSKFIYDFVLPFGGGQLKKILEGIEGLDKMGSYSATGKLQFPINQNQWLQVVLFGKYSTKEAKEYFDKQRTVLSVKQTVTYFLKTQKGENPQEVYKDIIKNRIQKEYEKELIKEVVKKIKSNPIEGLALIQLWKKEKILTDEMEKEIINQLK